MTTMLKNSFARPSVAVSAVIFVVSVVLMAWLRLVVYDDRYITLSYAFPLLLCLWHQDRRLLWSMAVAFVGIASVKHWVTLPGRLGPDIIVFDQWAMHLVNIVVVTVVVHIVIRLSAQLRGRHADLQAAHQKLMAQQEDLYRQKDEIQAQAEELAQQNEELQQQGEELSAQNEQLQQQALELEHQAEEMQTQSEELRLTGEELARREEMLQVILTALRGIPDEKKLLERIMEVTLVLTNDAAVGAAILEQEGDELVIRTDAGVPLHTGPLPVASSFAAMVMQRDSTCFVDDLQARPDLTVPRSTGVEFRSLLATPLRCHGQPVGTVELYALSPRNWTLDDFRVIEWVAAEASLALETVRLQEELRGTAGLLEAIGRATPDLIYVTDRELRVRYVNRAFSEMIGQPAEAMQGRAIAWSRISEEAVAPSERDRQILETGENQESEERLAGARGRRYYLASRAPLRDSDGKMIGVVGLLRDITERRAAEQSLKEAERRLQEHATRLEQTVRERTVELAATVAKLEAEAQRRQAASSELERAHAQLHERSQQLRGLVLQITRAEAQERRRIAEVLHDDVQQLLASVRFHTEHLAAGAESVQLRKTATMATAILEEALAATRSLTADLAPPALKNHNLGESLRWLARWMQQRHQLQVTVRAEEVETSQQEVRELLFRSVRELLFNVAKHAKVPEAQVDLFRKDGHVTVLVSDQGGGFVPDVSPQSAGGTGFGLFSVRERIELGGGRFRLESAPGQGTRVTLCLPVSALEAARLPGTAATLGVGSEAAAGQGKDGAGPKVRAVLVDDHQVARTGLRDTLSRHPDLEVVGEAATGTGAVETAARLQPDVVIMDVNLPDISGIEATRQITTAYPQIRVIGFSMHDAGDCAEALQTAGACGFVSKAAPVGELISALQRYCGLTVEGGQSPEGEIPIKS
jgi:PAS domain S-box-containing protein